MDLSEKYRPSRFERLWQWQDAPSLAVITNELARGKLQTPMLITGGYGEAKTTVARLIGRRATCQSPSSHPYEPCGTCPGCLRFNEIRHGSTTWNEFGYFEVDCTQFAAIPLQTILLNDTWGKLERTAFSRWVVCLDEIGRCDKKFQRSMLKLVENLPAHLILCCANEDPLDKALRDRCAIRPLTVPNPSQCVRGVLSIAAEEGFEIAEHSVSLLVTRLGCNPRRILKTLPTAVALGEGTVTIDHVETALLMATV